MILIIANSNAGQSSHKQKERYIQKAVKVFQTHDNVDVTWAAGEGDAAKLARQAAQNGTALVVAAGGDGTVHEVANGVAKTSTALALLPMGTENVMRKYAQLPRDAERCSLEILTRRKRQVDLGRIGNRYFLLFLGIGFDAHVIARTNADLKHKLGGLAFVLTAVSEGWKHRNDYASFSVKYDGVRMELPAWLMIIGNIPIYGWKLPLLPKANMSDGKLDACLFPKGNLPESLLQVAATFQGKHLRKTRHFQFKKLRLETNPPMEIQADGLLIGKTPCEVKVAPKALWLKI